MASPTRRPGGSYGRGATARHVLGHLTHEFAPGQITAVTGRPGTGKTTLLRIRGWDAGAAAERAVASLVPAITVRSCGNHAARPLVPPA